MAEVNEAWRPVVGYEGRYEGFAYLQNEGIKVNGHEPRVLWRSWLMHRPEFWVVRFVITELASEAPGA